MKTKSVNIDFAVMLKAMKKAVREKALQFGSSIIYQKDGQLVEENLRTKNNTPHQKGIYIMMSRF